MMSSIINDSYRKIMSIHYSAGKIQPGLFLKRVGVFGTGVLYVCLLNSKTKSIGIIFIILIFFGYLNV